MDKILRRVLLVGGTWDETGGWPSGLITKLQRALTYHAHVLDTYNGGYYSNLPGILESTSQYDLIFWFANILDNSLEKIRDVKSVAPYTLLVTSKRNDFTEAGERKYNFEELVQRALSQKANLCFEFTKYPATGNFIIRIFDPLGCLWYEGFDISEAVDCAMKRLVYLHSVTRKGSMSVGERPEIITYTDSDNKFLDFVKRSADTFHKLMMLPEHVDRFVGNASLRFDKPTRCMNGFPGIRKGDTILISRRNVDKTGITFDDFVPCRFGNHGEVTYLGDFKPSVDSPVQLRLFDRLSKIDYILHGHCYAKGAPMTKTAVPCGALEEIDEVMNCILTNYDEDADFIVINLKGHGCLIMAGESRLDDMSSVEFEVRSIPERIE